MNALTDYDIETLEAEFARAGHKPLQARRLLRTFYNNAGHVDLAGLKLGRALTAWLRQTLVQRQSRVVARSESADGTVKLLLGFPRGGAVEAVLMPTPFAERAAGCVSSQIGCAMGCAFCASTRRGLERNLEAGEIVEQFLHLREQAVGTRRRVATVVFMGMGEPLLNLDNVMAAIKRIAGRGMGDLGWRQVTVSTVGIVPGILKLAESGLNVNLALSLHAPDDDTRSRLVPLNKRYGVREVVAATKRFYELTRRITNIEYCLVEGVNDSDAHARALVALLHGFRTHVNLIPCNSTAVPQSSRIAAATIQEDCGTCAPPPPERSAAFLAILREAGIVAHLRQPRGQDVNAACGQLRETTANAAVGGALSPAR